jgi:hypothetical protein
MTGKQIVSEKFLIELGVDVEQCAALCHDLTGPKDKSQRYPH